MEIEMSALPKTWILDLDGTIVKHNGYKLDGEDSLLPGAKDFLKQIKEDDMVIFITSRQLKYKKITEDFLEKEGIKFNAIIYGAPYGERILVNDNKPSGLKMAYSFELNRNEVCVVNVVRNPNI